MLGGVASGIYVAMMRNRSAEEQEKNPVNIAPVVSFIMITSLLTGIIVYGIYYLLTIPEAPKVEQKPCPTCVKCLLSEDDFNNLHKAEKVITDFQRKASFVPDVAIQETCPKRQPGVGRRGCGGENYFKPEVGAPEMSLPPYIPINTPGKISSPIKAPIKYPGYHREEPKLQRRVGFEGFPLER